MHKLFSLCVGFIAGIIVSSVVLSDTTLFFLLLLSVILFIYVQIFERAVGKERMKVVGVIISFVFFGMFLGQFRVLAFNHFVSHDLEQFESHTISLVGKIISEPVSNGETQKFTFSVSKIVEASTSAQVSGNILVIGNLFPVYHYGDVLTIKGQLQKPQKVVEPDGRIFDYPSYLLKDSITETMSFGFIQFSGKNEGNVLIKFLYGIKEKFVTGMQNVLPEPEAGLSAGIVLGTQTISKNLSDNFRTAGLSHIVVLSGYNITVVSNAVMAVALYIAPVYASFLGVFSVILFVLMSGAGASAVRAGIMTLVALLGKRFGKSYDAGRALFLAAFAMVLWNPMTLLYDPSFHLSFLATVAMIYFSPIVYNYIFLKLKFVNKIISEKYGKNNILKDTLATTLAVNLFVLPYILYMSGSIQVFSLPANLLVLPLVPATMFLGFFVGLFGMLPYIFAKFLGLIVGIPSYGILYYDIFIAQTISSLPFAKISIPNFPIVFIFFIYILFFYFLYKKNSSSLRLSESNDRPASQIVTSDGYVVIGD